MSSSVKEGMVDWEASFFAALKERDEANAKIATLEREKAELKAKLDSVSKSEPVSITFKQWNEEP